MNILHDWKLLARFRCFLRPHRRWIFTGSAAVPVSLAAVLAFPWLIMKFVDDCLVAGRTGLFPWYIGAMLAVVAAGYFADACYTASLQRAGQLAIYNMRNALFRHTLRLPRRFYDRTPVGAALTRLTSDMEALGESLAVGVLSLMTDLLKISALVIFLFFMSPRLAAIVFFVMAPALFFTRLLHRLLRKVYGRSWRALSDSTGFLQESLKGVKTIQLYNAGRPVLERYDSKNRHFLQAQTAANFGEAFLSTSVEGLTSLVLVLVLWNGARMIAAETLSLGVLIGFLNLINRLFVPIRDFTFQLGTIQKALAALEHIEELFREEKEKEPLLADPGSLERFENLVFDNVSFRYHEEGPDVLENVSFEVKAGQRVALAGPTGSGKSTVMRLILKAYSGYRGSIRLNGRELSEIPAARLKSLLSVMPQDAHLFEATAAFNIGLDRPGVGSEDIRRAARYVYADTFIERLPGGYEFRVAESGRNLSSGENQLVCFARLMAGDPDVILLDEATSSVDSVTEELIEKATRHIFEQKTVIAIAHRLSTIQNADMILVMENGKIVERGRHGELMSRGGLYSLLARQKDVLTETGRRNGHD